ncbi:MAG: hypothetical protein ACLFUI_10385, partial [Halanaerobiales bacterium]
YKAKKEYEIEKLYGSEEKAVKKLTLDGSKISKESIPAPMLTMTGNSRFKDINTLAEFLELMKVISWLPSRDQVWEYRYSPAAVLSQGWGTENDLANMLEIILTRQGFTPERQIVKITDEGYDRLLEISKVDRVEYGKELPAIGYQNGEEKHLLVVPFMKEFSQLKGLVELIDNENEIKKFPEEMWLEVYLKVIPAQMDRNARLRDIGAALAGGEVETEVEEIRVMSERIALDTLSQDVIDLGYIPTGKEMGDLYTVLVETADRKLVGEKTVDTGVYQIIGEKIEIHLPDEIIVYDHDFEEVDSYIGIYHGLAINLPDIKEDVAYALQSTGKKIHSSAENPDEISSLRWYSRTIIGRFLAAQSKYEKELAGKLGLITGRTEKSRCLMVTVKAGSNSDFRTSIDLLRVENDIHNGIEDAVSAFNIFSGLYVSKLEAEVLPGEKSIGLFEIWQQLPDNTNFVSITNGNRSDIVAYMEENDFQQRMVEKIQETGNAILIPS